MITEESVAFRVLLREHNQHPYINEPYELRCGSRAHVNAQIASM